MKDRDSKILAVLAVIFGVSAVLCFIVPVWYWAIVGMDSDIGMAWFYTCFVLVCLTAAAGIGSGG